MGSLIILEIRMNLKKKKINYMKIKEILFLKNICQKLEKMWQSMNQVGQTYQLNLIIKTLILI